MTPARQVTEPLRPVAAMALLMGNAVFLFIGFSDLFFTVTGWASQFGARSVATFDSFAGPFAIGLPLLAVLIATHVAPALSKSRTILVAALVSYAFSAIFGVITYLGAFAGSLFSVRATFDGLLWRSVWLCFLAIAGMAVYRVYQSMYPQAKLGYSYGPTVYGRPYPGQPMYPQPTYQPGTAEPRYSPPADTTGFDGPTAETGWPAVPSQLAPAASQLAPAAPQSSTPVAPPDPTVRISPPRESDPTRLMPPVAPPGTPAPAPPSATPDPTRPLEE